MDNKILNPLVIETKFDYNSVTRMKLSLLKGKRQELLIQIDRLMGQARGISLEIADIIGDNLSVQYLKDYEPCVGQFIVNSDFDYFYVVDQDLKLKCINEEIK